MYVFLKKVFDFLFSLLFILLFSPIFILVIGAIRFTSKGPVFFKQKRAGLFGKPFTIYKLNTLKQDKSTSKIGNFLRKTYIDELPQLGNVLIGNMSLVGPRPHILEQVKLYQPWQKQRLLVKPGITGLRQIECIKSDIAFNEKIELDLAYIDDWSIWLDCKVVVKTFLSLLGMGGKNESALKRSYSNAC